ncbi:hypothetical protein CVD25_14520 [Bacillus canaveralius]|uniref:Glycosyltransferase family 1 protein n=1 Tax=Bacillus canaveralius TaxID=1403243 RepID=A0A2N5GHR6_9BACI|nr:hypothetical protein CU635_18715 [Bacillus canaveralius]PLR95435.1 hypothetical protein CVD25_14520 [Bacillus canaveralius]
MRIGVNLLNLSQDRFGGIEQYVENLIWHLVNMGEELKLFLFLTRPNRDIFPDHLTKLKRVMFRDLGKLSKIHKTIHDCQLDLWFSLCIGHIFRIFRFHL